LNEVKPKGLKRAKDIQGSKEDFLRAAYEALAENGYHHISVEEIVTRAGRSKGGFYHHFRSKEEVFLAVFDQVIWAAGNEILQQISIGKSVREVFHGLLDRYEPLMRDSKRMVAAVEFFCLAIRNEETRNLIRQLQDRSVEVGSKLLEDAVRRGEFRRNINVREVTDMLFSAGRGLMIMSVILDGGIELPRRLRTFVDLQLRALENSETVSR
jgi:AcrR family transcriptional regulator